MSEFRKFLPAAVTILAIGVTGCSTENESSPVRSVSQTDPSSTPSTAGPESDTPSVDPARCDVSSDFVESVKANYNAHILYRTLIDRTDYTKQADAALTAAAIVESGADPKQSSEAGVRNGHGLWMLAGTNQDKLRIFAEKKHVDQDDVSTQVDLLESELRQDDFGNLRKILETTTEPSDASNAFTHLYLRPNDENQCFRALVTDIVAGSFEVHA